MKKRGLLAVLLLLVLTACAGPTEPCLPPVPLSVNGQQVGTVAWCASAPPCPPGRCIRIPVRP